jgi:hypothetical protein
MFNGSEAIVSLSFFFFALLIRVTAMFILQPRTAHATSNITLTQLHSILTHDEYNIGLNLQRENLGLITYSIFSHILNNFNAFFNFKF